MAPLFVVVHFFSIEYATLFKGAYEHVSANIHVELCRTLDESMQLWLFMVGGNGMYCYVWPQPNIETQTLMVIT